MKCGIRKKEKEKRIYTCTQTFGVFMNKFISPLVYSFNRQNINIFNNPIFSLYTEDKNSKISKIYTLQLMNSCKPKHGS